MQLTLEKVTLLGIDCIHPEKTIRSLIFSKRWVEFAKTVLVTDMGNKEIRKIADHHGIHLIHHVTGTRHDYEYSMLERMPDYFETPFVLFQEWDAAIVNPEAWQQLWLEHDYIGAPWPDGAGEERWWVNSEYPVLPGKEAPTVTVYNNVGNGGFSIRSKRFTRAVAKRVDRKNGHQLCSDAWMCRTLRTELMEEGIYWATPFRAHQFSCEGKIYSGQFGIHGKTTIGLNGWSWDKL